MVRRSINFWEGGMTVGRGVTVRNVPPQNRRFAKVMRQEMTRAELRLGLRLRKPGLPGLLGGRETARRSRRSAA